MDKKEIIKKYNKEILLVKNKDNKKNNFLKLLTNLLRNYKKQNEKELFDCLSRIGKI